ncbi:MAG: hypothetical protein GY828_08290 [Candidatus Gracilibacteria bacterium]|nr:hypothetical protein [Candidatus Gracilibacteria bacterium]
MQKLFIGFILFISCISTGFANQFSDVEMIQWHLNRTEGILRQVDTSHLSQSQIKNREKTLDNLQIYTEQGLFPNNTNIEGFAPFFQGENKNLCAVGYLMFQDENYKSYVNTVVNTDNNIKVMDINDKTFTTWLDTNGLTKLEAAMIQPTYRHERTKKVKIIVFMSYLNGVFIFVILGTLLYIGGKYLYSLRKKDFPWFTYKNKRILQISFILYLIMEILIYLISKYMV